MFLDVFGMFFEILFLDVCLNVCLFFLGWGGIEKKFGIFRVDLVWLRPMPKSTSSH